MSKASKMSGLFVKPSIVTESVTLSRNSSGRTHFLDDASGLTVTLPSPKAGLSLEFIVKTAPTGGNYTVTAGSAIIRGGLYTADVNNAADPNFETSGVTNVVFVANASKVGDSLEMVSDGTYWYAQGFCAVTDGIRIWEQSRSPSVSPSVSVSISPSLSTSLSPSRSPSVSRSASPS